MSEIKSYLQKEPSFKDTFLNIEELDKVLNDGNTQFRIDLLEYIDGVSDAAASSDPTEEFFYEYLCHVRFLPNTNDVAYTTPNKLIFLNPLDHIGKDIRKWEFVFDHECLHQLFDTFAVGKEIEKKYGTCDYKMLNIASDVVINDYLRDVLHKKPFENGMFPETIKRDLNVDFDRYQDTQFTLYEKCMQAAKQNPQAANKLKGQTQQGQGQQGQGQQGQGQNGQGQQGQGQQGQSQNGQGQNGQGQNGQGQQGQGQNGQGQNGQGQQGQGQNGQGQNGQGQQGQGQNGQSQQGQGQNGQGQNGQGQNGQGQNGQGQNGQGQNGQGQNGQGQNGQGQNGQGQNGQGQNGQDGQGGQGQQGGQGKGHIVGADGTVYDESIMHADDPVEIKNIDKLIDKFKNTLTGNLGDFVKKCKDSKALKTGAQLKTDNIGSQRTTWDIDLKQAMNVVVKKRITQAQREYRKTYRRPNRRSIGGIKPGGGLTMFKPGKQKLKDQVNLTFAFWIDRSGSMSGGCYQHAATAAQKIGESIIKSNKNNKVVNNTGIKYFVFDDDSDEVPAEKLLKVRMGGGTYDLDELVRDMAKKSKDMLINVVITDGAFDVSRYGSDFKDFIKDIDGNIIIVINNEYDKKFDKLASDPGTDGRLTVIHADSDFTLSK